ncbi:MAG: excinuclease ABC subunit UvrC, partial [Candidatus Veblenbacteria bacterium]|nr:excinuclease ABC subunit UvrC [Candidatus Veblenbacteria bacterium]
GKAKGLRNRVRSYFQRGAELSPAKQLMVANVHHLETMVVTNETEALLLERTLIGERQPPYNVDLKDDTSWLYLTIDYREPYPRVALVRRPSRTPKLKMFGPYVAASSIRSLFQLFKKTLGLKTCPNGANKLCFQASLGRCLGHDTGPGSRAKYRRHLSYLEQLLRGDVNRVVNELTSEMKKAAQLKQFERAARLRDQIQALAHLREKQSVVSTKRESFDVFGLSRNQSQSAIVRLPIRQGLLMEAERFLLDNIKGLSDVEVITGFLEQYAAAATDRAKRAFIPVPLPETKLAGTVFSVPTRGGKRQLLALASRTADTHLTQSAASWQRREVRAHEGLRQLQQVLKLANKPKRIEGYDISNIQGTAAVGSMVVLSQGLPDPKQYRKFKIQGGEKPNDFKMLAEVLWRRFTKNHDWPMPDLVMLDGGAGQLSVIKRTLDAAKIKIPLVALAKREELLYVPNKPHPIKLPADAPGLLLLESLRDEAHRFGITFYRSRHRKRTVESAWDELPGVGPVLKRKLKSTFGSLAALHRASEQELTKVVGPSRAADIKRYLV